MALLTDNLQDTPLWQNVGALLLEAQSRHLALKCVAGWHRAVLRQRNAILKEECEAWQFAAQGCSEWRKKYSLLQKRLTHEENRAEFATKACTRAQGDVVSLQEEVLSWKNKADAYEQEVEGLRKRLAKFELQSVHYDDVEPQWRKQDSAVRGDISTLNLSLNEELAQRQRAAVSSAWSCPRPPFVPPSYLSTTESTHESVATLSSSKDNLSSTAPSFAGARHVAPSQPTMHAGDASYYNDIGDTSNSFQKSSLAHPPLRSYHRPQPTPAIAAPQVVSSSASPSTFTAASMTLPQERDASSAPWPRSGPFSSSWNPMATHSRDRIPPAALRPELVNGESALNETLRESLLRDCAENMSASAAGCTTVPSLSSLAPLPDMLHRQTQQWTRAHKGAEVVSSTGAPRRPWADLTIQVPSTPASDTVTSPEGVANNSSFRTSLDSDGGPGSLFLQPHVGTVTRGVVARSDHSTGESARSAKCSLELLRGIRLMGQEGAARDDGRGLSEAGACEGEDDGLSEARTLAAHILRRRCAERDANVDRVSKGVEFVDAGMERGHGDVGQRRSRAKPDFSDII